MAALIPWLRSAFTAKPASRPKPLSRRLGVERLEARENPSGGTLDTTFGTGGTVTFSSASMAYVKGTAVQPDGMIVSVGTIARTGSTTGVALTRVNPNGTLDTSFGTGGTVKLAVAVSATGAAVALQSDGKIVVGAQAFTVNTADGGEYAVARLNANGSLDTSFGNNHGWWLYNPTSKSEKVEKVAVGADGSIYVGGEGPLPDGSVGFAAAKLSADGLADPSFGYSGVALQHTGAVSQPNQTYGMALSPAGGIVLVGFAGVTNPDHTTSARGCVVDLDPRGQLQPAFNGTGYVLDNLGAAGQSTNYYGVAVQGNNFVVIGQVGGAGLPPQGVVARYTPLGVLDATFGTGGLFLTAGTAANPTSFLKGDIKLEADGSIVALGVASYTDAAGAKHPGMMLVHLSADGVLDTTFGTDGTGYVTRYDLNVDTTLLSLSLDSAGNIDIGSRKSNTTQGYLLRFTHP